MTDDLDQQPFAEAPWAETAETPAPSDEQVVEAYLGADVEGVAATDTSIASSLPSIDDINLKNAEKAAKKAAEWAWDKVTGHRDEPPEPEIPTISIDDHEETSTRSTWVEHDDPPPPPPPPAEHPAPQAPRSAEHPQKP